MRNVLINPLVDAAVLEITPQMVAAEGLGIEDCDVALVTAPGAATENGTSWQDELGEHDLAERLLVESVRRCGAAVLPAGEAITKKVHDRCPGDVVLYGIDGTAEPLARHRSTGGRAVYVENKRIVASDAHRQQTIVSLGRLAAASKQQTVAIEDLLAATAAAWFLGIAPERIGDQLATFVSLAEPKPVVIPSRGAAPPSVNLQETSQR
jgi:cyanophycin synthetase